MANTSILAAFERTQQHVVAALSNKSDTDHTHDDRYYTESEIDIKLNNKAESIHNHDASNITSGILSYDRLEVMPITKGGTGATTAAAALTNLGAVSTEQMNAHNTAADAHTDLRDAVAANEAALSLILNGSDPNTIDSVNDLINYVNEHGSEVTGIKQDIKDNADDIADTKAEVDALESYVGRFDRKVFCDTVLEYNADENNWYSADLVNFEDGQNYYDCIVELDGITYTNISFEYGFEGWVARGLPSEISLMIEGFVQSVYMGPGSKEPGFNYNIKIYQTLSNVTASTVVEYVDQSVSNVINTLNIDPWTFTLENGSTVTKAVYVGVVPIITFTIGGTSYTATEGMTWGQWVNSAYNTQSYMNSGNTILTAGGANVRYNNANVTATNTIISNGVYAIYSNAQGQ